VFALAKLFGIQGNPPPLVLRPDSRETENAKTEFKARQGRGIAVHISARRPAQRWPAECFAELIRALVKQGTSVMLLWSPGPPDHPQHPGDDDKASEVMRALGVGAPVTPYPTRQLPALIGALAACDTVICSDGGAMHLAAALGKPIVALFGDSPPERWRPWGVEHRIVRAPSRNVAELSAAQVLSAYAELAGAPA
jgi:ADP-heptose:LPS heptosyltransferase